MAQKHTILVVDDEADVVKSVKDLLRLDYKVLGTTRAAEAIDLLKTEEIHIVMTDQRMPGMTGVELLSTIRGDHPDAIRLLFTGYADIRAVIEAIDQGNVYRYITKPWDPDELQTVIRDACAHFDLLVERKRLLVELQQKNEELTQANELKSAFIQVASHEFRTPLAILLGLSKLAMREQNVADGVKECLGRIDHAAARLEKLVNQILTLLTAQKFDHVFETQPQELSPLLTLAAEDVTPFVKLRNQTLAVDLAPDLGTAKVDGEKIRDSLNHLLLNAIKFTPDQGRITLTARRSAEGITIKVTDTGSGMSPDHISRLFEPFFTGFDVSKHSSGQFEHNRKGLGLGLSVVKAFTEMHGGKVSVESEPGKGSTFTIFLPNH